MREGLVSAVKAARLLDCGTDIGARDTERVVGGGTNRVVRGSPMSWMV
jgi:hypothetical protein